MAVQLVRAVRTTDNAHLILSAEAEASALLRSQEKVVLLCRVFFGTIPVYGATSNVPSLRHSLTDIDKWGVLLPSLIQPMHVPSSVLHKHLKSLTDGMQAFLCGYW